jgi:methylenetetrahydrofolate reductase (NADPH)
MTDLGSLLDVRTQTLSFEFFPPKDDDGDRQLAATTTELAELRPDFFSVTYGAGGSTRARTTAVAAQVQAVTGIAAVAHLTCVGVTRTDLARQLDEFHAAGIRAVVALRGDPPEGQDRFVATPNGCANAQQLLRLVRADGRFTLMCAAYPDGHPQATSREADWEVLAGKFDAGAQLAITQCFFAVDAWRQMNAHVRRRIPTARIVPGILPVLNYAKLLAFCARCGAMVPADLHARFAPLADDPAAMRAAGLEFTVAFCEDLLRAGAPGLHIYSLNRSSVPLRIVRALRERGVLA